MLLSYLARLELTTLLNWRLSRLSVDLLRMAVQVMPPYPQRSADRI